MRKLLIILFCFLSLTVFSQPYVYYVSPYTGNDAHSGLDTTNAWSTPQKAFETADAGDTVYFLDGVWRPNTFASGNNVYYINPKDSHGNTGVPGQPICYFNYPGASPVFDFRNLTAPGVYPNNRYITGIAIYDAHFLNWKGIELRNVYQRQANVEAKGMLAYTTSNFTLENMVIHDIGGPATYMYCPVGESGYGWGWGDNDPDYITYDSTYMINCDIYQVCDTFPANNGQTAMNQGDGFKYIGDKGGYVSLKGCRAWFCVDDGFDIPTLEYVRIDSCWSFHNMYPAYASAEGNGFKVAGAWASALINPHKEITNTLTAWCDVGIYAMNTEEYQPKHRIYNNTMAFNKVNFYLRENIIRDTLDCVLRNNISYAPTDKDNAARPRYADSFNGYYESHNTWDYAVYGSLPRWIATDTVTVTDADFILSASTPEDSTAAMAELTAARHADWSLPDITFMKLAATSDLINAGTVIPVYDSSDVTLLYSGAAPDIGYAEYSEGDPDPPVEAPLVSTGTPNHTNIRGSRGSGVVTSAGGGTISARGICLSTSTAPDTGDTVFSTTGTTGSFNITITGLLTNTTYHIRAYATNETGTSYGSEVDFTTPKQSVGMSGTNVMVSGGNIIIIR